MSFNPVEFRSRPLFAATCLALLTTALPAGAFVLGEIRTESHLGAPLRASVPLRLEAGEWIDSKCVKIVPDSVSGLEINSALPQARVETATDNSGRIIISTRQSLSEPIVRFNLQLNCGSGFFSREYTLLLDPEEQAEKRASAAPATMPTTTTGQSGGARERRQLAPASELPPVRRSQREKPARLAPRAVAKPLDFEPKLRLSADGDATGKTGRRLERAAAASSAGGFRLKLTSELNLERIGRKLTPNERTDLQQKLQLGRSDDDMAEILRLRNQIETLEAQMLTLRQTAMATMGINPPAAPDKSAADPAASPTASSPAAQPAVEASGATAEVSTASAAARPDNSGNPLGRWADIIIWVLAGAVTLGFGYMLWLYRAQHADNLGLPELFDDHAPEPAYRPDIPISRKLVNQPPAADARATDIVVPDKDRWAIEEAQILLAQGWREQAVNLLQEQIDNNPYQLDIWLMLFELHHKTGNSEDFATLAARFHNIAKGLPVWNSIRQMGQSLDPENPLYAL